MWMSVSAYALIIMSLILQHSSETVGDALIGKKQSVEGSKSLGDSLMERSKIIGGSL